jgi:hypothetical protein
MESAKQCRDYADECVIWAKEAKTDHDRDAFLKMARGWRRAANIMDGSEVPTAKMK